MNIYGVYQTHSLLNYASRTQTRITNTDHVSRTLSLNTGLKHNRHVGLIRNYKECRSVKVQSHYSVCISYARKRLPLRKHNVHRGMSAYLERTRRMPNVPLTYISAYENNYTFTYVDAIRRSVTAH